MPSFSRNLTWPPDIAFADSLQSRTEDSFLEYKRQWHDLESNTGKAEFVKDVLALANTVTESQPGLMAVGVDETESGGTIVGVDVPPTKERISQILSTYTTPVPNVEIEHLKHPKGIVSFVGVFWSRYHPHYAIRASGQTLDPHYVYCRRGAIVSFLLPRDLEDLIRQKDARLGPLPTLDPLQLAFVEINDPTYETMGTILIRNVSDEPIRNVRSFLDISLVRDRRLATRKNSLVDATIQPGETREIKFRAGDLSIWDEQSKTLHQIGNNSNRAFDLTATVQYRDRNGFIQERSTTIKAGSL